MSQRESGYARKERDFYATPAWVTEALLPHLLKKPACVWEPAAGALDMVNVLSKYMVAYPTDICTEQGTLDGVDFLTQSVLPQCEPDAIITNPPYELATEFCENALRLMEPVNGMVAMLLRTDFDHAKSRTHLFRDCPAFAKKLVLMKRICWFVEADGKPKASPSFNHAWYIWDWKHQGPPTISYGP